MLIMLEKADYDALLAQIADLKTQIDTKTQQLADALNLLDSRVATLEKQ